jgi:hypothetical protein
MRAIIKGLLAAVGLACLAPGVAPRAEAKTVYRYSSLTVTKVTDCPDGATVTVFNSGNSSGSPKLVRLRVYRAGQLLSDSCGTGWWGIAAQKSSDVFVPVRGVNLKAPGVRLLVTTSRSELVFEWDQARSAFVRVSAAALLSGPPPMVPVMPHVAPGGSAPYNGGPRR